jgi:hypothetical protein
MTSDIRLETGKDFRTYVKAQADRLKSIPNDEKTLEFIKEAFQKIAAGRGTIVGGGHTFDVKDLNDKELRALCRLSKKFFDANKDMHLEGEFLANIQTVRNRPHPHRTGKLLDPLRLQIYHNETVEPTLGGAREKLQTELLTEIKTKGIELENKKKKTFLHRLIGWTGSGVGLGVIFGAGLGVLTGVALTAGAMLILWGVIIAFVVITVGVYNTGNQSDDIAELVREQEERIWAFELLQNKDTFNAFCEKKGIEDPENVTFDQLIDVRYTQP